MKNQKGITLIALIITIIVMLILVAVTINVALNGGIFTKAKDATLKTEIAQIQEQLLIAKAEKLAENNEEQQTTNFYDNKVYAKIDEEWGQVFIFDSENNQETCYNLTIVLENGIITNCIIDDTWTDSIQEINKDSEKFEEWVTDWNEDANIKGYNLIVIEDVCDICLEDEEEIWWFTNNYNTLGDGYNVTTNSIILSAIENYSE